MNKQVFGLIGLGVMGQNFIQNVERNGFSAAVYNRSAETTEKFIAGPAAGKNIKPAYTLKEFVDSLESLLIDCEGHISDEVLGDALRNIHMKQGNVKFLGSYPSTYGTEQEKNTNREAVSNADSWLSGIRAQIR